jgi:sulfur relay (sulfurtransferase) DsrF/TusC family protein
LGKTPIPKVALTIEEASEILSRLQSFNVCTGDLQEYEFDYHNVRLNYTPKDNVEIKEKLHTADSTLRILRFVRDQTLPCTSSVNLQVLIDALETASANFPTDQLAQETLQSYNLTELEAGLLRPSKRFIVHRNPLKCAFKSAISALTEQLMLTCCEVYGDLFRSGISSLVRADLKEFPFVSVWIDPFFAEMRNRIKERQKQDDVEAQTAFDTIKTIFAKLNFARPLNSNTDLKSNIDKISTTRKRLIETIETMSNDYHNDYIDTIKFLDYVKKFVLNDNSIKNVARNEELQRLLRAEPCDNEALKEEFKKLYPVLK